MAAVMAADCPIADIAGQAVSLATVRSTG